MLRHFKRYLPATAWAVVILLVAKISASLIDMTLPPVATLECAQQSEKSSERYTVAKAFGLRKTVESPTKKPTKSVTNLKGYTLTMTAIGSPSMAIIVHRGKSKLIAVNETIDGFKLTEVYTDRVKLTKNGREYWLTMKKKGSNIGVTAGKKKSKEKSAGYVDQIRQEGDTYYIPRELLNEMRDIKKIFRYIAMQPVYRENKLVGFGITNVKKGSVFDKMGLRKRDLIEKIDGKPIKSETEGFKYFNRLDELSSMTLTIKRGSKTKELHYEIF